MLILFLIPSIEVGTMVVRDLNKTIRGALVMLGVGYLLAFFLTAGLLLHFDRTHHQQLAKALSDAVRNFLVTRDFREAVTVLNTAVSESFAVVSFTAADGRLLFRLPSETAAARLDGSPWITNVTFHLDSTATNHPDRIPGQLGSLSFEYKWLRPVELALALWLALLALAIPIFRVLKAGIHRRHSELIRLKESEVLTRIAQTVSHDLRAPVSALNFVVKSLGPLSDENSRLLNSAITRINDIASDLLHKPERRKRGSAQVGDDTQATGGDAVNLRLFLKALFEETRAAHSERKNMTFKLDLPATDDAWAKFEVKSLARAVSNLLTNAVEAIEPPRAGEVTLALRIFPKELAIVIVDNGKGIPEHVLQKLGREQVSAGKSDSGNLSGNGIGVFEASRTVALQNGKLRFQSQTDQGTIVTITLPRNQATHDVPVTNHEGEVPPDSNTSSRP